MNRAAIIVLGMHRSGTSALTWLVGRMGASLPADAIRPTGDNARGYWESAGLVKADDQLLRVCRSSWFDPRPLDWSRLDAGAIASRKARIREAVERGWGGAPLLAIKDPRQCRMVPLVEEVLGEMGIEARALLMLRDAGEIARSLAARDGTTPDFARLLWLRHMIDAERATRGMQRAVVDYDTMLHDWRTAVRAIAPLAGRDGWAPDDAQAAEIEQFLDPDLRHHRDASAYGDDRLEAIIAAAEAGLHALRERDDPAARATLDEAYRALDDDPAITDDIIHAELRARRVAGEAAEEASTPAVPAASPGQEPSRPQHAGDGDTDADLIRASNLFDTDWYLARYPDVRESGLDPVDHYVGFGAAKGYDPSPLFNTIHYARQMARRDGGSGSVV